MEETTNLNQPEIKEEVISVGSISPPKRIEPPKIIFLALGGFFVLASIILAIYLVKQRQEIRKEATGGGLACRRWEAPPQGYQNPPIAGWFGGSINFYRKTGNQPGEEVMYRCDYRKAIEDAGGDLTKINCDEDDYKNGRALAKEYRTLDCSGTSPENACYTNGISNFIDPDFFDGKCQVIQIDLTGCTEANTDGGYPSWDGGVAFVIAYNSECPEVTPTPSPTITVTPSPSVTPTPTSTPTPGPLTCISLLATPPPATKKPGDTITLTCSASGEIPIEHFEFRVSIDSAQPIVLPTAIPTPVASQYQGQISYQIPRYGCYKVECRACGAQGCTQWGQAH